ncbi:MAG: hypothetical protein FJ087_22695, partial [Deltaproteobacteria bacterium]|nr:hypothetical protein [Deltaproteobacteria bacterium]
RPAIERMLAIARSAGALGGKLTGAGGGGSVVVLPRPGAEDDVVEAWAAAGHGSLVAGGDGS